MLILGENGIGKSCFLEWLYNKHTEGQKNHKFVYIDLNRFKNS